MVKKRKKVCKKCKTDLIKCTTKNFLCDIILFYKAAGKRSFVFNRHEI